jgi:topoisomerase-4 subunit A
MDDFELDIEKPERGEEIPQGPAALHSVTALSGMYQDWFLDYASYVILERAVPHLNEALNLFSGASFIQ